MSNFPIFLICPNMSFPFTVGHENYGVIEEIGALRPETKEVAVCLEDVLRLLPECAAERFLGKEEVREVRGHELKIT